MNCRLEQLSPTEGANPRDYMVLRTVNMTVHRSATPMRFSQLIRTCLAKKFFSDFATLLKR